MATIKDVARMAGVSTATVSHVLNNTKHISPETTKRVMDAKDCLEYEPHILAKSLRVGKTYAIGVLAEDIRGMPTADIINGIGNCAEKRGYHLILNDLKLLEKLYNQYDLTMDYREQINNGIALLMRARVDGIIYVGMHDRHLDGVIAPPRVPLVYAYTHATPEDYYVCYDNRQGARDAMAYLIKNGHTRIGILTGPEDSYPSNQRLIGAVSALKTAGISIPRSFVRVGDWEYKTGVLLGRTLLSLPERPTAIFAMNDLMAAGCLNAAAHMGIKVPEQLSIIGFDNREIASYTDTPLTTVQVPINDIGRESGEMLMRLVDGLTPPNRRIVLPCRIIRRQSVKAI